MSKPKIFGIGGRIGSGKSYTVGILSEKYKLTPYVMSDLLKKLGKILLFEDYQLYGTQEQKLEINKIWGISARQFLQKMGTEVFRDFVPTVLPELQNVWVKCMKHEVSKEENKDKIYIIDGIRFKDELEAIQELGGVCIKINALDSTEVIHGSEDLSDLNFDYEIFNEKDESYKVKLFMLMDSLMK